MPVTAEAQLSEPAKRMKKTKLMSGKPRALIVF
jgi:hypothetical protein